MRSEIAAVASYLGADVIVLRWKAPGLLNNLSYFVLQRQENYTLGIDPSKERWVWVFTL